MFQRLFHLARRLRTCAQSRNWLSSYKDCWSILKNQKKNWLNFVKMLNVFDMFKRYFFWDERSHKMFCWDFVKSNSFRYTFCENIRWLITSNWFEWNRRCSWFVIWSNLNVFIQNLRSITLFFRNIRFNQNKVFFWWKNDAKLSSLA